MMIHIIFDSPYSRLARTCMLMMTSTLLLRSGTQVRRRWQPLTPARKGDDGAKKKKQPLITHGGADEASSTSKKMISGSAEPQPPTQLAPIPSPVSHPNNAIRETALSKFT